MGSHDPVDPAAPPDTPTWSRDEAKRSLGWFALVVAIAVATIPLGPPPESWLFLGIGVALAPLIFMTEALLPWRRLPSALHVLPPLIGVVAIELVRHTNDGPLSGYAPLFILPVVWSALFGTRRHVAVIALAIFGAFASDLGLRHQTFTGTELRQGILWVTIAFFVGFAIRSLVMRGVQQVTAAEALSGRLRRSEHETQDLVRASRDAIVRFGRDGVFRYASPAAAEVYGWPVDELLGTSALARIHPDDLQAMLDGGLGDPEGSPETTISTFRFERSDGTYGWLEGYRVAIHDSAGHVVEFQSTVRNVTARKLAEAEHRLADLRFKHAFANAPTGVALVGVDGTFQTANAALCRILGRSEAELTRMTVHEVTHPDDRETGVEFVRQVLAGDRDAYALEKRYVRPDGSLVPARLHVSLVRDDGGEPLYFISQVVDVSELTDALEAVRTSELRFRTLLESAPVAVLETDRGGNALYANEGWLRLSGLTLEQSLGQGWAQAIHPEDVEDVEAVVRGGRCSIEAGSSCDHEYRLIRPDGVIARVAGRAVPLIDELGECIGYLSSGQDVTERHVAEERLRDSESNLKAVADAIRRIQTSDEARSAICEAATSLSTATVAWLLELDDDELMVTAATDERLVGRRVVPGEPSASGLAMSTGERLLVEDVSLRPDLSARLGGLGLRGCVFEPVVRTGRVIGVLSIGWARPLAEIAMSEIDAVGLLADEAATVIERSDLIDQLARLARHDALTGLENRRVWEEELEREITIADRTGRPLSITVMDLDHFKHFNDTYGHQAGDDLLVGAAHGWTTELRRGDRLVRYGGEEFAMLLPDTDLATASTIADRFRRLVPGDQTCSVGIAQWRPGEDAETFFASADRALYRAKNAGRNRVALAAA